MNLKTDLLDAMARAPRFSLWIATLSALILLAVYALTASLITSMEILEFSARIPWATMIAMYIFLVAAGSGLCIINALGSVFGMHRYELMSRRMAFLSLISIVFGMLCIVLHLGHPERMPIYNTLSPNFRSAISWMGLLYTVYLVVVVVELWVLTRDDLAARAAGTQGRTRRFLDLVTLQKLRGTRLDELLHDVRFHRLIGTLAFVSGASALSMLGSVFAHSESRLLWYGPYYPVYFLVSAIFSGYALLLATTIISYRVRGEPMPPRIRALMFEMAQALAVVLAVGLLMIAWRMGMSLAGTPSRGPALLLFRGPFKVAFWGFEVGLLSVAAVIVLMISAAARHVGGVLAGALMVLVGTFVMRYEFVVAGQVFPNIKEGLPSYLPAVMELFVIAGVLALFLLVYTLGEVFLPIGERASGQAGGED